MIRFFTFALSVIFLSGCATTGSQPSELQQCQSRIAFLEEELKEKDHNLAQLERDLQRKENESFRRSPAPAKGRSEFRSSSIPATSHVQKALKSAGYYKGPVDGKMGAKTQEAVMKFQNDNGLKADGKVGQMTWLELKSYLQ